MAFSFQDYTNVTAGRTDFSFGFTGQSGTKKYLKDSDIKVYVNGVSVPFTLTSDSTLSLTTGATAGATVRVRREMPNEAPHTNFSTGNSFSQSNVNNTNLQELYLQHELMDGFVPAGHYFKQDMNFGGYKAKGLAKGSDPQDAATVGQLNTAVGFASVAAMLAATLEEGEVYGTKGYYSPGDGGHGSYLVRPYAWLGSAPDGHVNHIVNGGTHTAVLQREGAINIKQGGVKYDGTDQTVTLQAIVDYALAGQATDGTPGVKVFCPSGSCYLASAVKIAKSGLEIECDKTRFHGPGILFDIGDYTDAVRVTRTKISGCSVESSSASAESVGIKLYRTSRTDLSGIHFILLHVGIDSYRSSTTLISDCYWIHSSRTINGLACIRLQGTNEASSSYTPGGGMHITNCEFSCESGDGTTFTESVFLVNSVDGLYIDNIHAVGYRYGLNVNPLSTPENHTIFDIMVSANVYFDQPAALAVSPIPVRLAGSVKAGIVCLAGTVDSSYQGIRLSNVYLRGADRSLHGITVDITDAGGFVSGGGRVSDIQMTGGSVRKFTSVGINARGTASSNVVVDDIIATGVYFEENNLGGGSTASDIRVDAKNIVLNGNTYAAAATASAYSVLLTLSVAGAALNVNGESFSASNYTDKPVQVLNSVSGVINISDIVTRTGVLNGEWTAATDAVLTDLVSRFWVTDTVDTMQDALLFEDQLVKTRGYYSAGDGGGAEYLVVAGNSSDGYVNHLVNSGTHTAVLQISGIINVKQAGSTEAAFSAAAKTAQAGNAQEAQKPNIPFSDWATVYVPSGNYTLTDYVDTGNKEIVWLMDVGTEIEGYNFLNGRVVRLGSKTVDYHHGTHDQAVSMAVMANRNTDEISPISGFTNPNQLSKGNGRDSVAFYSGNRLPGTVYSTATAASFSSLGVTFSPPLSTTQLKQMKKGMVVETQHATKYAAYLESWSNSALTIKDGWFLVDGSDTGTPATPPNTAGIDINVFRKAWAINANVFIDVNSHGNAVNTVEFGMSNDKGDSSKRGGGVEANGVYSAAIGSYHGNYAFFTGGRWYAGSVVRGGVEHAFLYDGMDGGGYDVTNPLLSLIYAKNENGIPFFQVKPEGTIEAGLRGSGSATPISIDFHSGSTDSDYDSRISSSGGTGVSGNGTLTYTALEHVFSNTVRPGGDASVNFGRSDRRWLVNYTKEIRPGTGTAKWTSGVGSPEGVLTAVVGSMYTREDGGASTTLYIKESGSGNTGWIAK